MGAIRAKAVCVVRRGSEILVAAARDAVAGETFYGPPGGGIEFGERAADAVRREFVEELGAELTDLRLLGVLENLFTYEGRPGHEITFVFDGRLADAGLYAREALDGVEGMHPFQARWEPLARFADGGPPLYPTGLLALLRAERP